jgi:phospholipid/cholesterol/gamma-HCH transport system ATP-binding protein
MPDSVIDIQGLWTQFGPVTVHQDLDLQVKRGDIVSLVGGSGSGKTTLLRQMLGLEKPARGTVRIFGNDINSTGGGGRTGGSDGSDGSDGKPAQLRNRWGMLFQQGALFSALTTFENVALPLRELRTLPEELIRPAVLLKLGMVGLTPQDALKMPADLSGGMVKRVALARALVLEPELLFLDEPTAGLDPDLSESFVSLIRDLHHELGLTVVMVTHDLDTLFALSTSIAVLADKRVIANGAPEDVLKLDHPFIRHFFHGERGKRAMEVLDNKQQGTGVIHHGE